MVKQKDISNKALAGLLIAAIVISLSGTMMVVDNGGVTGYDTYSNKNGTAALNVTGTVSIKMTDTSINFGSGYVKSGYASCHYSVDKAGSYTQNATECSFAGGAGKITIENDGNVNANVTLYGTKAAADFIGGASPSVKFTAAEVEAGACDTGTLASAVELTTSALNFCDVLEYGDSTDHLGLELALVIPSDAIGEKSNTLVFEASQSS